jgi:hypothetical protein
MNAGETNKLTTTACHATKLAPAAKRIKAISITTEDRRDVMGRQRPEGHGNYRHKLDTRVPWTKHVLLLSNSAIAAAHPGKPSHSRRSERSNGLRDPLEHG